MNRLIGIATTLLIAILFSSCNSAPSGPKQMTIGVSFETLQTEYWVAGFEAIKRELKKRNIAALEAIAG